MNPRFGGRQWVKLWVNEWLDGTTRFEMTDAQRAFWIDLLAMAGRSRFPGTICAGQVDGKYVGYPLNRFQSLLSEPLDVEETLKLFERTGKITIETTAEAPVRLLKVELINWNRYQSEYQRQKKYRKRLQQSDSKSDTQSNKTEVEVEVEGEGEGEKNVVREAHDTVPPTARHDISPRELLGTNELKGLLTVLQKSINSKRTPAPLRREFEKQWEEVQAILKKRGVL